ncbi:accessory gene regulator B family protein [Bacillota bacterium LX-D]|nr:accessory gene regulator B family protein [Bacillota bacterium LX-D]
MNYSILSLEKLSNYLAEESGRDQEVILYGLQILSSVLMGYVFLIIISWALGIFVPVITAALTSSIFRAFSGGAHASSKLRCSIIGLLILIPIGFCAKYTYVAIYPLINYIVLFVVLCGIYVIYKYVPADTPQKPINSTLQKKVLKTVSMVLFMIWIIVCFLLSNKTNNPFVALLVYASTLGMFWQLVSVTPWGYKFVDNIDHILQLSKERRD